MQVGDALYALTGSHRIEAAKRLDIEVPYMVVDPAKVEAFAIKTDMSVDEMLRRYMDDDDKLIMLKEIGDLEAVRLLEVELEMRRLEEAQPTPAVEGVVTETITEEGEQIDMFGRVTRVAPPSAGIPTQMSMEEYAKYQEAMKPKREVEEAPDGFEEAYEAQAKIDGIKETLARDPVAHWRTEITVTRRTKQPDGSYKVTQHQRRVGLESFISIKEQEFPQYLTLRQARQINPDLTLTIWSQEGTKEYNRVPKEIVLDELADELGMTPDGIANRVTQIRDMRRQLREHYATIRRQMTETPLPVVPEPTATELAAMPKEAKMPLAVAIELSGFFGEYVMSEDVLRAYELQRALRSKTKAGRFQEFSERMQVLQIEQGLSVEQSFQQAKVDALSSKLPIVSTDFFDNLTDGLRDALFTVVYHNEQLQQYPTEMVSTLTALTNALNPEEKGAIPRKRGRPEPGSATYILYGPEGSSAWDRLNFVFGKQPKVLQAIDKMATDKKSLRDAVDMFLHEDVYRVETDLPAEPIPIDEETAEYLRNLPTVPFGQAELIEAWLPRRLAGKDFGANRAGDRGLAH